MPKTVRVSLQIMLCLTLLFTVLFASVPTVAYSNSFYLREFRATDRPADLGMTEKDTMDTARALMNYLRGRVDTPQVTMKIEGETRPFYNDRELTHLADVRVLFAGGYRLMYTALVVTLVIAALLIFAAPRSSWLANLWNTMVIGGLGAVGVLVAVGLLVATDFERLFWTFHIVSFSNDMWLLDPATDWLIRMFPESFFYHAAVRIVVTAVLFLTAIAVVGIWQRTRAARKSIATSTD